MLVDKEIACTSVVDTLNAMGRLGASKGFAVLEATVQLAHHESRHIGGLLNLKANEPNLNKAN